MNDRQLNATNGPDEQQLALLLREDLKLFNRTFPNIWDRAGRLHLQLRGLIPEWSFLTNADADQLLAPYINADKWAEAQWDAEAGSTMQTVMYHVNALATWRFTQGIYRFDPDVFQALWDTPLMGKIPVEVLTRLPETAVYIPWPNSLPRLGIASMAVLGFMVVLNVQSVDDPTVSMSIFIHRSDRQDGVGFDPITIPFVRDTIEGSLENISRKLDGVPDRIASSDDIPEEAKQRLLGALENRESLQRLFIDIGTRVANLVVFLATQNETYAGRRTPAPPKVIRQNGKKQVASPNTVTVWDVAVRVGQSIRAARTNAEDEVEDVESTQVSSRKEVRPHVRRAHWHGFWSGPIDKPTERKFELRWLPPILVKVKTSEDLPAVIHHVKGEINEATNTQG